MPVPDTIAVKYTLEEAEYVNLRPITRQVFRRGELLDMIVRVTGKSVDRIQKVLRSGTIVFNSYRYWWQGIDATVEELQALLVGYPDSDPQRAFQPEQCVEIRFYSGTPPHQKVFRLPRRSATAKRLFRMRTFWESVMARLRSLNVMYLEYSYADRGDLFSATPTRVWLNQVSADLQRLAPRSIRTGLKTMEEVSQVVLVCSREGQPTSAQDASSKP